MMNKYFFSLLASTVIGSAMAETVTPKFDADDYIYCDSHSLVAVQFAKTEFELSKKPGNKSQLSQLNTLPIDIKLTSIAFDAIKTGYLESAGEKSLQRFLTGICYESKDDNNKQKKKST